MQRVLTFLSKKEKASSQRWFVMLTGVASVVTVASFFGLRGYTIDDPSPPSSTTTESVPDSATSILSPSIDSSVARRPFVYSQETADGRRIVGPEGPITDGKSTDSNPWLTSAGTVYFDRIFGNLSQIYFVELGGESPRRATAALSDLSDPTLDPTGQRLAAITSEYGADEIVLIDLNTGWVSRIGSSPSTEASPSWSPDGSSIAFSSDRSGAWSLYVYDVGTDQLVGLAATAGLQDPAWSPDGARLVGTEQAGSDSQLVVVDPATGDRLLTVGLGSGRATSPTWIADDVLLFSRATAGQVQLVTVDLESGDLTVVTSGGIDTSPHAAKLDS